MQHVEPLKDGIKLSERLNSGDYKSVIILFGHGLGDCIMFVKLFDKLQELYPNVVFNMALQKGLSEEFLYPNAFLFSSVEEVLQQDYDLCASINFPVEIPGLTKSELCCREELGIESVWGHKPLPLFPSRLVAVHFNLTSIPEAVKPTEEVAQQIWNEIRAAGYIPIETHFSHVFDNPENKMFPFIDCTVRKCQPKIESLLGLISHCTAFIGVVSGPFHVAMSILPHDRIGYLEKNIPVARFTHEDIKSFDIKNFTAGSIKDWLDTLT
jgi:hypothetical protein